MFGAGLVEAVGVGGDDAVIARAESKPVSGPEPPCARICVLRATGARCGWRIASAFVGVILELEPTPIRVVVPCGGCATGGKALPGLHRGHSALGVVGVFDRVGTAAIGLGQQASRTVKVCDGRCIRIPHARGAAQGVVVRNGHLRSAAGIGGGCRRDLVAVVERVGGRAITRVGGDVLLPAGTVGIGSR